MRRYLVVNMLGLLLGLGVSVPSIADQDETFAFKHFHTAAVSLGEAIEIAERESKGKAVKVEFDFQHSLPVWDVKILSAVGFLEYAIDADSGKVAKVDDDCVRGRLYSVIMEVGLNDLEAAKAGASQAVLEAERQMGARAVSLDVERKYWRVGPLEYNIVLRSEMKWYRVKVDSTTGLIVFRQ